MHRSCKYPRESHSEAVVAPLSYAVSQVIQNLKFYSLISSYQSLPFGTGYMTTCSHAAVLKTSGHYSGKCPFKGDKQHTDGGQFIQPIRDPWGGPRTVTSLMKACDLLCPPQFLSLLKKGFGSHYHIRYHGKANLGEKGFVFAYSSMIP